MGRKRGGEEHLEGASEHELHDEVDAILRQEDVAQLDDVRVVDGLEDLDLGRLEPEVLLQLPPLLEDLHRHQLARAAVARLPHGAEGAASERVAHAEGRVDVEWHARLRARHRATGGRAGRLRLLLAAATAVGPPCRGGRGGRSRHRSHGAPHGPAAAVAPPGANRRPGRRSRALGYWRMLRPLQLRWRLLIEPLLVVHVALSAARAAACNARPAAQGHLVAASVAAVTAAGAAGAANAPSSATVDGRAVASLRRVSLSTTSALDEGLGCEAHIRSRPTESDRLGAAWRRGRDGGRVLVRGVAVGAQARRGRGPTSSLGRPAGSPSSHRHVASVGRLATRRQRRRHLRGGGRRRRWDQRRQASRLGAHAVVVSSLSLASRCVSGHRACGGRTQRKSCCC